MDIENNILSSNDKGLYPESNKKENEVVYSWNNNNNNNINNNNNSNNLAGKTIRGKNSVCYLFINKLHLYKKILCLLHRVFATCTSTNALAIILRRQKK